jgi:hypothetical protein
VRRRVSETTFRKPAIFGLLPQLDEDFLQQTVEKMLRTINEPEYREEIKRTVDFSYTTTLEILERLAKLGSELSLMDKDEKSRMLNNIVPGFIKSNISLTIELMGILQKQSAIFLDILERGRTTRPKTESGVRMRKPRS